MLELADSLALRNGNWNLERTVMIRLLIPMHLGSVVFFTDSKVSW